MKMHHIVVSLGHVSSMSADRFFTGSRIFHRNAARLEAIASRLEATASKKP